MALQPPQQPQQAPEKKVTNKPLPPITKMKKKPAPANAIEMYRKTGKGPMPPYNAKSIQAILKVSGVGNKGGRAKGGKK